MRERAAEFGLVHVHRLRDRRGESLHLERSLVDAVPPTVRVDVAAAHAEVDGAEGHVLDRELAVGEADRGARHLSRPEVVSHLVGR